MSHRQTNCTTFSCDADGCGETFISKVLSIKGAWTEAEQFGWTTNMDYVGQISRFSHFCPSHGKMRKIL